jgi:O-phospho-L-seryl-tRNASec:L-selenocysteinyl-tRNA synthase
MQAQAQAQAQAQHQQAQQQQQQAQQAQRPVPAAAAGRAQPAAAAGDGGVLSGREATFFGSMLWARGVSGTRVVARGATATVAGMAFGGYGAHCDNYPCDYLTAAAAIGGTRAEVDAFVGRLTRTFDEFKRKQRERPAAAPAVAQ